MSSTPHYDWDEAFAYYVALGTERSYEKVAQHLGTRKRTVTYAAGRYDWPARLAAVERKARERSEQLLVRDRAERNADTLKIIDAARTKFAQQLRYADFRLTGADFVGLIKLEQLLEGEATERISISDVLGEQLGALIAGILDELGVLEHVDAPAVVRRHLLALGQGDVVESEAA